MSSADSLHTADPSDPLSFRRVMGCFATGVAVVSTLSPEGLPAGITINSFTSVSLDPPLVLFCLDRTTRLLDSFSRCRAFAITFLRESQQDLSTHFARPDPPWTGIRYRTTPLGSPVPEGGLAHMECTPHAVYDGGDHIILTGRVTSLAHSDAGKPLLYFRSRYCAVSGN
ncbi:MAG: flavin reductase family protein [Pseudomonadota bacterium]|nr:flavin reductase family protein [Pseudomonadota bacterium]